MYPETIVAIIKHSLAITEENEQLRETLAGKNRIIAALFDDLAAEKWVTWAFTSKPSSPGIGKFDLADLEDYDPVKHGTVDTPKWDFYKQQAEDAERDERWQDYLFDVYNFSSIECNDDQSGVVLNVCALPELMV
jgi:hypothetical protein